MKLFNEFTYFYSYRNASIAESKTVNNWLVELMVEISSACVLTEKSSIK